MNRMTIGTAAREAGVGVETIRFYERKGLIAQPPKTAGSGFRDYPRETIRRVRFIRQAQQLGFGLREIDDLLSLRADPDGDCRDVRDRARLKLRDVSDKIARLERIRDALNDLIAACPGRGARRRCSILALLAERERGPHAFRPQSQP